MKCPCGDDRAKHRTIYWPNGEQDKRLMCDDCWVYVQRRIDDVRDTYHRLRREGVPIGHIRRILTEAYRPTAREN